MSKQDDFRENRTGETEATLRGAGRSGACGGGGKASRREFLKTAMVSGMGVGMLTAAPQVVAGKAVAEGKAKNLILMVADGMNLGTLSLANHYKKRNTGTGTSWMSLYEWPGVRRSLVETWSANSLVTDSAAAGSAWGIGERVNNGSINVTPDGRRPVPAWVLAKQAGKLTGLVTTTRMSHATPASFATNVDHRDEEDRIAEQYRERGMDVLLGGGSEHFAAEKRKDGKDLWELYGKDGYTVLRDRSALRAWSGSGRVLGIFGEDHLPYALDLEHDPELRRQVPSLEEMTEAALEKLKGGRDGFVLMVEGGRVDHAGHANDAAGILREQLAFDEAVAAGRRFVEKNPDTLLIVTTDHGTGGAMLNGVGPAYLGTNDAFGMVDTARHSFEYMFPRLVAKEANLEEVLEASLGFVPGKGFVDSLAERVKRVRSGEMSARKLAGYLAEPVGKRTGIHFTSQNHTADLVELVAVGPGSETIPPALENWQLHEVYMRALGIG